MKNLIKSLLGVIVLLSCLNANEIKLNEVVYTDNNMQEKFYPIGFGKDKFAYIKHIYEEGIGSYYWKFNVINLVTDEIIISEKTLSSGFDDVNIPSKFLTRIKENLANNKIYIDEKINMLSFPTTIDNYTYNAYLESVSKTDTDGIVVEKENIQFSKNNDKVKCIGKVETLTFFGQKKYYGFKIVGFLKTDERLLIIVSYKRQEDEESKIITSFKLFGSHLEV